jgi:hypothetical protein
MRHGKDLSLRCAKSTSVAQRSTFCGTATDKAVQLDGSDHDRSLHRDFPFHRCSTPSLLDVGT